MAQFLARPLAKAVQQIILLAVLGSSTAIVTSVAMAEDAVAYQYDIPATTLDRALSLFSAQSGIEFAFDPKQVKHLSSQGLKGTYRIDTGFAALLTPHGLQIQNTAKGYVIVAVPKAEVRNMGKLQDIEVQRSGVSGQDSNAYQLPIIIVDAEDQTSYAAKKATIGKTEQTLKEIPQSVSVITQQQIQDQGFTTIAEILNQATGVTAYGYGGSENYQIRFAQANTQINGVPQSDNISNEDPALYERIEVLRGPSGLLTGSGDPSGSINYVRKRPTDENSGSVAVSAGSWGSYRSEFDASLNLTEDDRIKTRVVGVYNNQGKFRENEKDDNKSTVYAVVEYALTDKATFGISGTYINEDYINFWGLPLYADGRLPKRDAFVGYNDLSKRDQKQFATDFSYEFDNGWKAKIAYNQTKVEHENYGMYAWSAMNPQGLTTAGVGFIQQNFNNEAFDANLSGDFTLFGKQHQFLIGYNQWENDSVSGFKYTSAANWDVLNNHNYDDVVDKNILSRSQTLTKQSGLYASSKIKLLDPLTLTLGGRWTDYRQKDRAVGANVTDWVNSNANTNNEFTPYAGLVWDINHQFTWYASYADSFVPQTEQTYLGQTLDPRIGWQIETGLKADFFDGALNATAAIYQIRDKNRAMLDTEHVGCETSTGECSRAAGEVQARGAELEISGKPTENLNLIAGYTYNDLKYLSDTDSTNVGKRFAADTIPEQLFKLWSVYRFDEQQLSGHLSGWDVGLGLQAQSNVYNDTMKRGGFTLFSAKVGYTINPNWQASVQVNNLFDKTYLKYPGNSLFYNVYGEPRNVMFTLKTKY